MAVSPNPLLDAIKFNHYSMKRLNGRFFILIFMTTSLCSFLAIVIPLFILEHKPFALSSAPTEVVTLQLQWKHQFQFAGYYAAKALGYYQKAGLDVQIKEAEPDINSAQFVLRGKAEFGISNSELLLMRDRGEPVVALASIYQHSPLIWLVTKNSGIDNIHNLAGKRVMLESHGIELVAYLNHEGIDLDSIVQIPHTFDPLSLITGKVDAMSAYSTDEPFILKQSKVDYLTFNPRASGIDFYGDTLFTTEQELKHHPHRVKAFVEASLQGWEYALQHPDEMIDLIYKEYSQRHSRDHLAFEAQMTQNLIMPDVVELGYMNPGRWRYIGEIYQSLGMISKNFSLKGFIYNRNEVKSPVWLYISLGISLLLSGLVSFVLWRFYRFKLVIQKEIHEKNEREKQISILEKKYRILVENSLFSVIISGLDGKILYMNSRAAQQFDISQSYALNLSTKDFYASPEDRKILLDILKRKGFVQDMDFKFVTSRSSEFWASISVSIIEFEGEQALFTALIDITRRKMLSQELEYLAMTDELTQLYNRRFFLDRLQREFKLWQRYKNPFSVLLIDIDHFKNINDHFGHDIGDLALKFVAKSLKDLVREVDTVARYGGEEFIILLPQTQGDMAKELAERLLLKIATSQIELTDISLKVTVSIGVAEVRTEMLDLNHLLKTVDNALYQAKWQGRNQVVMDDR
jgi:diguanylate cyclase (GGDEF)-like protein/PAS domain S-box-containing protein